MSHVFPPGCVKRSTCLWKCVTWGHVSPFGLHLLSPLRLLLLLLFFFFFVSEECSSASVRAASIHCLSLFAPSCHFPPLLDPISPPRCPFLPLDYTFASLRSPSSPLTEASSSAAAAERGKEVQDDKVREKQKKRRMDRSKGQGRWRRGSSAWKSWKMRRWDGGRYEVGGNLINERDMSLEVWGCSHTKASPEQTTFPVN